MFIDPSFVMRVRALEDVYPVLATFSKTVQSTKALRWERQAGHEDVASLLEQMRIALVAQFKKSPSASELLNVSEKEVLWPNLLKNQASPPAPEVMYHTTHIWHVALYLVWVRSTVHKYEPYAGCRCVRLKSVMSCVCSKWLRMQSLKVIQFIILTLRSGWRLTAAMYAIVDNHSKYVIFKLFAL